MDNRWEAFTETVLFRGGIKDLPVGVRAVSRSNCSGKLVPSFWKAMGLTQTGESLRAGKRYFIEMVEQNLKVDCRPDHFIFFCSPAIL